MNVCIIGGGNIGTGIAACAAKNGHRVRIFASRPAEFQPVLRATDPTTGEGFSAAIDFATNDLKRALSGADVICGIYPSFMIWDIFLQIRDTLVAPSRIGVFPGTGARKSLPGRFWKAATPPSGWTGCRTSPDWSSTDGRYRSPRSRRFGLPPSPGKKPESCAASASRFWTSAVCRFGTI